MSDLISRDEAIEMLKKELNHRYNASLTAGDAFAIALYRIKKLPAVDAVEVVRCKDCRYAEDLPERYKWRFAAGAMHCTLCRGDAGYGYANASVILPDDYCSDGAKMDGGAEDAT